MKGTIFIALNEMVEETAGIHVWESALDVVKPESEGVYTSVDTCSAEELIALVVEVSRILEVSVNELVRDFGKRLFTYLYEKYPSCVQDSPDFFCFIESINDSMHEEVKILFNNTYLPVIECQRISNKQMRMRYISKKRLCFLAEGLIMGVAKHFGEEISFSHLKSMNEGKDYCEFDIRLTG